MSRRTIRTKNSTQLPDNRIGGNYGGGYPIVADEDTPRVSALLFYPGVALKGVISIDVLDGFKQELSFETEDDGTVIRNLRVPDYPLILRLQS